MSKTINIFAINDIKQNAYFVSLPKQIDDVLNINFPKIIHEVFWEWISSGNQCHLHYQCNNVKLTFVNAYTSRYFFNINRYGNYCTEVYVRFNHMIYGIRK